MNAYPDWPNDEIKPAVSCSAINMHNWCARSYINRYVSDVLPPAIIPQIQLEARVAQTTVFVGKVVDATIDEAIRNYKSTGSFPTNLQERAKYHIRMWHDFSKGWATDALNGTIGSNRDYYQPLEIHLRGQDFSRTEGLEIMASVRKCIENFYASPLLSRILSFDRQYVTRGR